MLLLSLLAIVRADQEADRNVAALWSELHGVGHEVAQHLPGTRRGWWWWWGGEDDGRVGREG